MSKQDFTQVKIGVVGAGAMGQGIAQVALTGGMNVRLFDAREDGAKHGLETIFKRIDRLVEKDRLDAPDAEHFKSNASVAGSLGDFADCDVVIEAIFEDLELKQNLFDELED